MTSSVPVSSSNSGDDYPDEIVTAAQVQTPGAITDYPEVDSIFTSFITNETPGAAVIVVKDGAIQYEKSFGLSNLSDKAPLTTQHIFQLGSVGKMFTALAVMILAEEGKIQYDDPIGKYLPELAHFGDTLTIRTLLQHTSGLPDYSGDDTLNDQLMEISSHPTNADALLLLSKTKDLVSKPGEKYSYNNAGYDTLAALVERLSGQPFQTFLQERIFTPLQMTNTFSLPSTRKTDPMVAHSYEMQGDQITIYDSDPLDTVLGSGSLYSTVEDMARFDQGLYTDEVVSQATLQEAFKPVTLLNGEVSNYGFGWEISNHNGIPYVWHDGSWLGFLSQYVRFPKQHLSVIILQNKNYNQPEGDLGLKVADMFLSGRT
ncbi:MAG TPA: serine hydrolase domain-containing protein [Methanospirillum sp.]|nr:serine hydrolase domain-containing protein [Methanospirillum sp.]